MAESARTIGPAETRHCSLGTAVWLTTLTFALFGSACGESAGGGEEIDDTARLTYYPYTIGDERRFRLRAGSLIDFIFVESTEALPDSNGLEAFLLAIRFEPSLPGVDIPPILGPQIEDAPTPGQPLVLGEERDLLQPILFTELFLPTTRFDPALLWAPADFEVGDSFTATTSATVGLVEGDHRHTRTIDYEAIEEVTVPAGTFPDALRARIRDELVPVDPEQTCPMVVDTLLWLAPHVGPIKRRSEQPADGCQEPSLISQLRVEIELLSADVTRIAP